MLMLALYATYAVMACLRTPAAPCNLNLTMSLPSTGPSGMRESSTSMPVLLVASASIAAGHGTKHE